MRTDRTLSWDQHNIIIYLIFDDHYSVVDSLDLIKFLLSNKIGFWEWIASLLWNGQNTSCALSLDFQLVDTQWRDEEIRGTLKIEHQVSTQWAEQLRYFGWDANPSSLTNHWLRELESMWLYAYQRRNGNSSVRGNIPAALVLLV